MICMPKIVDTFSRDAFKILNTVLQDYSTAERDFSFSKLYYLYSHNRLQNSSDFFISSIILLLKLASKFKVVNTISGNKQ